MRFIRRLKIKRLKKKIDSLMIERERWKKHWCGTPRIEIEEEIVKYYFKLKQHNLDIERAIQEKQTELIDIQNKK